MMAHERDLIWQPLRESLQWYSNVTFRGWGGQGTAKPYLLEPPQISECRDYNILEKVRSINIILMLSLAVVSMDGCLSRPRRISSYLPADRASAFFFLVGAAQRANSESLSGPVLFAGEQEWWCGMLIYLFVCFKLFGRTGRTIVQIIGFALLSRWEMHVKLGVVFFLGIGLFEAAEEKRSPRDDGGVGAKADTPPSSASDRVKMFEEAIFRFAALTVVLVCYPHIMFDEVTTPSGTYPGQLSLYEYDLIGEVVRIGVSQPDCGRYKDSAFAIILYGRVFGTPLFKACQASLAYLMARMLVTFPVFLDVFPRCKCALATFTANARSSSTVSNAGSLHYKAKKAETGHNKGGVEQPGDGDSMEEVSLRIQLRSMHRSLAAAVIIIGIDAAFDPFSRLRNDHRGQCISGEDIESYAGLHERLRRDLSEVTAACFAAFTLAITRGAQEELTFALALHGPSGDRDLLKCVRVALAGTAAVVFCVYVAALPYLDLVTLNVFYSGTYGQATAMAYLEYCIVVALAALPWCNLLFSFLFGNQMFGLPRWLEDIAILASSARVQKNILFLRWPIVRSSHKLLYYPVYDQALWVPWNIGKSQGLMDLLPEMFLVVYQWCSLFEIVVDMYRDFSPFCLPASRHLRLGLVSKDELDRPDGSEMSCVICAMSLVDGHGGLNPGPFGNSAGEVSTLPVSSVSPVSSTVEGGVTAATATTCVQSRCSCKRFLHSGCATMWLKISPQCPRCQVYLHGGLDLWQAGCTTLACITPKSIRSLARETWWSWTESALIKVQYAATYVFDRRLPWGRKEHVLHRKVMLAFGAFIDAMLELRDEAEQSNSLLENTEQELRRIMLEIQVQKAKMALMVVGLEQVKLETKAVKAKTDAMMAASLEQNKTPIKERKHAS